MSDLFLTAAAHSKAEQLMSDLIKEYNNEELTQEGKRDVLLTTITMSFIAGFKLAESVFEKENAELKEFLSRSYSYLEEIEDWGLSGSYSAKDCRLFAKEIKDVLELGGLQNE